MDGQHPVDIINKTGIYSNYIISSSKLTLKDNTWAEYVDFSRFRVSIKEHWRNIIPMEILPR